MSEPTRMAQMLEHVRNTPEDHDHRAGGHDGLLHHAHGLDTKPLLPPTEGPSHWQGFEPVFVIRNHRRRHVGGIDPKEGVYQWGGRFRNGTYRASLFALGPDEWDTVNEDPRVLWLRFLDVETGATWSLPIETAREEGRMFNGGVGARYGIPVRLFTKAMTGDPLPAHQVGLL